MSWSRPQTTELAVTEDTTPSYNLSMKFGSFLGFPSRLIARLRKVDELFNQDVGHVRSQGVRSDWESTGSYNTRSPPPPPSFAPLPGPWGFMTSGYLLGLIAMAVLLNRIQNIVVPSRHPFAYRFSRQNRNRNRVSFIWTFYWSLFPLDFSSTSCRLLFRIPSLYFLGKVLFIWCVILLQVAGISSTLDWNLLHEISHYVAHKATEDVCWSTFVAVCSALIVEALTRGLEGAAAANTSPFNLFGYAFLLHIYSSPITHAQKLQDSPSRPDKHVVFTIIMPLLQLTMIHFLGVKQRWSRQRLIPTGLVSITSLVHFHIVLWSSPSSYPLLNYMPCIFETSLALVTLLTIGLNALTQLLLEGTVTRPLFGHQATLLPKWDEDFSIVLLRLGTASLEATSVAGLGNEVGRVNVSDSVDAGKSRSEYGTVEMNRFGVMSVSQTTEVRGRRRKMKMGFANEIRNVKVGSGEGGAGELWIDAAWYRELAKFGIGIGRFARGVWRLLVAAIKNKLRHRPQLTAESFSEARGIERRSSEGTETQEESEIYDRFLRGDNVSDDDEEFEPADPSGTPSTVSDAADGGSSDEGETVGLYADLSTAASSSTSAPLMLAHMTDATGSPLTRRRYSRLLSRESGADDWSEILNVRRKHASTSRHGADGDDTSLSESRRNCVVCTVEPRQIICWPCRCLALCDDCRENLASRSAAAKHTCPCCRRNVEGYSKIFVP